MAHNSKPVYIQTPQQWEELRPLITKLWSEDGLELSEVMREVENQRNFKAKPGMFKSRLKAWGLKRYYRQEEVEAMLQVKRGREALGKKTSFVLGGHQVDMAVIERNARRKHIRIPDGLYSAPDAANIPGLSWHTPPASPSSSSDSFAPTPRSSSDSYSHSPGSLPRAIASPTRLGHCEEYLLETGLAFQWFITAGLWDLSKSTEMPWFPGAASSEGEPVVAEYYWQDECSRHLSNGVELLKNGDMNTAFKEWNAAFAMIRSVVQVKHYNTLGKLLGCIRFLEQNGHTHVAERFRLYVGLWARHELDADDPNLLLFGRLRHLACEDIEELQMKTQEILVQKLGSFLGPEAFTSFEHKLVLNEWKLAKDPSLDIDASIPSNERCNIDFGPGSSKTMLALNMRNGILQRRGALQDAHDTCMMIVNNASMVEDPAKRLWHLAAAWISLARLQSNLGQFQAMRLSLRNAWNTEGELRNRFGRVKLGEGELNWIFETLGLEPVFREANADELGLETLSLS